MKLNLQVEIVLLVSSVYIDSHTYESILRIAKFPNLKALAIIAHSPSSKQIAQVHTLFQDNAKLFLDKKQAMAWLKKKMKPAQ